MQLLLIHSDFIEFEAKRPTKFAEKIEETAKKGRLEEALCAFIAVEKFDVEDQDAVVVEGAKQISDVAEQVHAKKIMLYPYAHLSPNLSDPDSAVKILKGLQQTLSGDYEVVRAPFGWYKAFILSCKGHPLSELSRSIKLGEGEVVSQALKSEAKAVSYWMIMDLDGTLVDTDRFDFSGHENLVKFTQYEIAKSRAVDAVPPHVELMRRLELVDYEPGSDSGNMRYYPKGRLIKGLLENYVLDKATDMGAMEVETPIMYDMEHPTLKKYLDRFPARQYQIEAEKKRLFLRFAACFGQFLMGHDMTISYKSLPLKMFEITRYSFRREQRGELVGLRRLRAFTMPDMHTLTLNMNQAVEEFKKQFEISIDMLRDVGLDLNDYEVGIRFTKDFYSENQEFVQSLVDVVKKPVLIEMWDERFFYFVLKFEFNFIDTMDKASALSTVQIDVENAERYDIAYVDEKGEKKRPILLHCSPSGAIERVMYALLEKAARETGEGKLPMFKTWLSPTQVRIIPIAERHQPRAFQVAQDLGLRVDVDDREETVSKKIRDAGREWIPYVAVIGDDELASGLLSVTIRSESTPKKLAKTEMSLEDLRKKIQSEIAGKPWRKLPLPVKLSERPKFI
ncbi:MAG: threonine--tRNA ligase [Methanotrichaceae archaeon]|nr:threonine--tRNA ligase [Methanotrichaceae archaeon]